MAITPSPQLSLLSDKPDFFRGFRKLAQRKIFVADLRESSSDDRALLKYSAEAPHDHIDDLGRIVAGYWDPICITGPGSSTVPNALDEVHESKNGGVWSKVASDLE